MPPAPPDYVAGRWARLRRTMADKKVDALLVTDFTDVGYLTEFGGDDSYLLIGPEKVQLISDSRFEEEIAADCPWVEAVIRKAPMPGFIAEFVKKSGYRRVGIDPMRVTVFLAETLGKECGAGVELIGLPAAVLEQREVKDAREVELIRSAARIAEKAFRQVRREVKPGMTEREIAGRLEYLMRAGGADEPAFPSIVAAGPRGSLPHARATDRKVAGDDVVLFDWGAYARKYNSDLTRVIRLGSMPAELARVYDVVLEAQQAAIRAIGPGKTGKEIDAVARGIIEKAGYKDRFGHGLGHGLGREVHERPALTYHKEGEKKLAPGNVVTVEPGIYLPGVGGVRIEDDVLVTADGHEVLSDLEKDPAATAA
jgi:Xaa-Pro aminopeptidase